MRWFVFLFGGCLALLPGVVLAQTLDESAAPIDPYEALAAQGWFVDDPAERIDADLVALLADADLLQDWHDTSPTVPALTFVKASSDDYQNALNELRDVLTDRRAAATSLAQAQDVLEGLRRRHLGQVRDRTRAERTIQTLLDQQDAVADQVDVAASELAHAKTTVNAIAVARYMGDNLSESLRVFQTGKIATENRRAWVLETTDDDYYVMIDDRTVELAQLDDQTAELNSRLDEAKDDLVDVETAVDLLEAEIADAELSIDDLTDRLSDRRIEARELLPELHRLRLTSTISDLRVSIVAVDAYMRATSVVADKGPECALDWAALGGVARVESHHGTYLDRAVLANGDLDKPLYGILLAPAPTPVPRATNARETRGTDEADGDADGPAEPEAEPVPDPDVDEDDRAVGGPGFAVIYDTDGGALDGNAQYDRAVGPMQFLPETWSNFAVDGNDDGTTNPQNMYDATATAANYLCYLGGFFETADFGRRLLGYNASDAYVAQVLTSGTELRSYQLPIVSE